MKVTRAANHWDKAIESHATNFPDADHWKGDIREAPVEKWPVVDLFWASPECPQWSSARGKKRDYHNTMQGDLFDTPRDEEADRSRALMEEVPEYLRGVIARGGRVRAGVVENVVEVRNWDQWDRWLNEIRVLGYSVRVIAMNSMHAQPGRCTPAPQSRDRLYVAYWDNQLGRTPDWDKWLRPQAFCEVCEEWVSAVQSFKRTNADMGRYGSQYVYRCPHVACRNAVVTPPAMPASAAIDWSLPGTRIGDRDRPLKPKTRERIRAGIERYWGPLVVPVEGRDGKQAQPVSAAMRTMTTRAETGLMVPCGGTWREEAAPLSVPMSTRTTREADGVAFIAELRGGSSDAREVRDPLSTVTASGNHHGLVTPPLPLITSFYGKGTTRPAADPLATVTAIDRHALVMRNNDGAAEMTTPVTEPLRTLTAAGHQSLLAGASVVPASLDVDDVLFRMLQPHEIGRAMAFGTDYIVLGNKRQKVRQYGNAVTPPVAEIIVSALTEAITGEAIERWPNGFTSYALAA